jgi:putative exosortase-associated protein (TIGR04073 family)
MIMGNRFCLLRVDPMNMPGKSRLFTLWVLLALFGLGAAARAQDFSQPNCPPRYGWTEKASCWAQRSAGEPFSFRGFGTQLGRGLLNVGFFWLEVPYQIKTSMAESWCGDDNLDFGVFTMPYSFVAGLAKGTVEGVVRGVNGVCEVVLSPIPPYTPLNCPAYPPFMLWFNKVAAPGATPAGPAVTPPVPAMK